jgi:hypothetical protein
MSEQEDEGYVLGDVVPIANGPVYEELRRLYGDELPRPIRSATVAATEKEAQE